MVEIFEGVNLANSIIHFVSFGKIYELPYNDPGITLPFSSKKSI
ncbi:MAG: hypothetical protein BWY48_00568 [Parcubacteria group bacterium ADurb.Bin305]|nr:MAG: hypothetical protein BWY48_00568 [Parcubacteria group bacterium ADurb.Bin305]